jgi:Flp pilus assembly protein TadD
VRSVRQELRLAAERPERTPVRVRLALSAALARAGRGAEARTEHDALDPFEAARHAGRVPAWARP